MLHDEHFDRHQFEQPDSARTTDSIITKNAVLSKEDAQGMQLLQPKAYPHYDAAWANDPKQVTKLLHEVFPALFRENDSTPMSARRSFSLCARWREVSILYFAHGWDRASIADRMGMTFAAVDTLIRTIRRARKGLRGDVRPRRRRAQ